MDFNKDYDSVRREVLCDILTEFGIPVKIVRLIKMCLNETYSRVQVGKYLSGTFPIINALMTGDALFCSLFNFALKSTVGKNQANMEGLKMIGIHHVLVLADDTNLLVESINTTKKNTEASSVTSKKTSL